MDDKMVDEIISKLNAMQILWRFRPIKQLSEEVDSDYNKAMNEWEDELEELAKELLESKSLNSKK